MVCGPWDMIVAHPLKKNKQEIAIPVIKILVICCLLRDFEIDKNFLFVG